MTQIKLIGYFSIVEIIFAILTAYYLKTRWGTLRRSRLWPFLLLIMAWFISAVITDIFRETELALALKGSITPLLWASAFIAMYFLLREQIDLMRWFILGAAISGIITLYIFKPGSIIGLEQRSYTNIDVYSYRILIGVITTFVWAAVLFLYPRFRRLTLAIMFIFGLLSFFEGSRSAGAVAILAALLFVFRRHLFTVNARSWKRKSGAQAFKLVVLGLIAVLSISEGYRYAVLEGWLGEYERQRYLTQSRSKVGILGGRSEFAAASLAIADSPVLGHGSWARDVKGYRLMGAELLSMDTKHIYNTSELLIPGHSHLWGTWISHGFLGFLFWFYVLIFIVKFLTNDLPYVKKYLPFLLLLGIGSLWHIIFSPVGFRPIASAGYVFMILLAEDVERVYSKGRQQSKRQTKPPLHNPL